jgi:hypothetical protein
VRTSLSIIIAVWLVTPLLGCDSETDTEAGGSTTLTDAGASSVTGCVDAGGTCGCAGSCNEGYAVAPEPLRSQCPQPCAECGGCSQECCLPVDAGTTGCTGTFECPCGGDPVCQDGQWICECANPGGGYP